MNSREENLLHVVVEWVMEKQREVSQLLEE
jgi:hypothetical protein